MNPSKNLSNFIDHLIICSDKRIDGSYSLNYDDLDTTDQAHIVSFFLEVDDRDIFSVYENERHDNIVSSFILYLGNDEKSIDFAETMRKNAINYYHRRAQELIDDRCGWLDAEDIAEHGYMNILDRNSGEYNRIAMR